MNTINHPTFGEGTVMSQEGMFTVAQFECGVRRVLNTAGMAEVKVSKPAKVKRQVFTTPVQDMCEMIFRTNGVWSAEHTNLIARIHQLAHEQGNEMVDNIAHNLMKTHMISPAQASVLGRFAVANNITL